MSLLMEDNQNKKLLSSPSNCATTKATISVGNVTTRAKVITLHKHPLIISTTTATKSLLTPSAETTKTTTTKSNVHFVSSSALVSAISMFSMAKQQPIELAQVTSASSGSVRKISRTMPSFKIMSYQNIIALLAVLVCGLVTVNGLKCYMCGQYNEGVGSITPCLNYSEQYAHLYLKECSKKSEKYCVKYVSELSIVRDCATECAEKEIWETQTYCCTEDGCNDSAAIEVSAVAVVLPLVFYIINEIMNIMRQQRR